MEESLADEAIKMLAGTATCRKRTSTTESTPVQTARTESSSEQYGCGDADSPARANLALNCCTNWDNAPPNLNVSLAK
eukprot:2119226-Rhodomonas_salina.1